MESERDRVNRLLLCLRLAVQAHQDARAKLNYQEEETDRLKTEMYEAYQPLRQSVNNVLGQCPANSLPRDRVGQLKQMIKDSGWSVSQVYRYRALEVVVEEQQEKDRQNEAKKRAEEKEKTSPRKPQTEGEDDWVLVESLEMEDDDLVSLLYNESRWKIEADG